MNKETEEVLVNAAHGVAHVASVAVQTAAASVFPPLMPFWGMGLKEGARVIEKHREEMLAKIGKR